MQEQQHENSEQEMLAIKKTFVSGNALVIVTNKTHRIQWIKTRQRYKFT